MQKVIVVGANGQLGSEINRLAANYAAMEFVYSDIDTLDLTNTEQVENFIKEEKPAYLINCAAYTAVDKAEQDIKMAELINAIVPGTLAKLSTKYGFKLVHISTDYVFSGTGHTPLTEETPTEPASVYGKTKLQGEELVTNNSDAVIIRTSWLYSVYGNNFVKSMLRLGAEKEKLGIVFDQVGTPTNAADLAETILIIVHQHINNNSWFSGIYHYSNEGVCSWFDFAFEIMNYASLDCKLSPILTKEYPLPAPRPAFSVMNKRKIKETYNIEIPYWKVSLDKTLKELLK
jgi:dTDP-4-dehydrorhamnose reductase